MRFSIAAIALFSSVVSVYSASHLVLVGDNGTLAFNPSSIQAAQGDTVSFEFRSKNHSVTQSTFANPCALMATPKAGVDSGFQLTSNTTTTFAQWTITIDNATAPLWFFCAHNTPKNHCQAGMVFAINPTAEKSFDAYLKNAMNTSLPTGVGSTGTGTGTGTGTSIAGATSGAAVGGGAASSSGLATSLGSVPTNSVPAAATGLSSNTGTNDTLGSGAVRLSSGVGGLLSVAGLVVGLML